MQGNLRKLVVPGGFLRRRRAATRDQGSHCQCRANCLERHTGSLTMIIDKSLERANCECIERKSPIRLSRLVIRKDSRAAPRVKDRFTGDCSTKQRTATGRSATSNHLADRRRTKEKALHS
ncbi:hypothetical protein L533_0453 [Bordetella bronchiseptica OSU553]|nr:hypothetical protein L533_0453 [Bordetella bronchiseptica OSU553]